MKKNKEGFELPWEKAFLIFQIIPLPPGLVQLLSPETGVVWQKSLPAPALVN